MARLRERDPMRTVHLLLPSLLTALTLPAGAAADVVRTGAAPVFRCDPAAGSQSLAVYSDQPCPKGQAVHTQDPRSREQQQAAAARAQEEGRWAQGMARQRLQDERRTAAQPQRQPSVIGKEKVDIAGNARSQALREAELRRMARPHHHRHGAKPPVPWPPAAGGGSAPTASPGRP